MQTVEPVARRRLRVFRNLLRQHARTTRHDVASRRVHRAGGAPRCAGGRYEVADDEATCASTARTPVALEACPTGAIIRNEFEDVFIQPDICNGCGYCVPSCPFGVVDLIEHANYDAPRGFASDGRTNDDATQQHGGVAGKCTLCYDRQKLGLHAGLRKGVSDRIDPVRQRRRITRARESAGRNAASTRRAGPISTASTTTTPWAISTRSFCLPTSPRHTTCRSDRCCRRRVSVPVTRPLR